MRSECQGACEPVRRDHPDGGAYGIAAGGAQRHTAVLEAMHARYKRRFFCDDWRYTVIEWMSSSVVALRRVIVGFLTRNYRIDTRGEQGRFTQAAHLPLTERQGKTRTLETVKPNGRMVMPRKEDAEASAFRL